MIEKRDIELFIQLQFPEGINAISQSPPEPDFLIDTIAGPIGIEHTRLIRKKDSNKIDLMAHTMIANRIMAEAELLFNKTNKACLMVHVNFRCDYGLAVTEPIQLYNKDIKPLSEFIAEFVSRHLLTVLSLEPYQPLDFETYDEYTFEQILPNRIESISIYNLSGLTQSCWAIYEFAAVPGIFSSDEWNDVFIKKNAKPAKYKNVYT